MMEATQISELQKAADQAVKGVRDPRDMKRALAEAAIAREEMRQRVGVVSAAVDLVREAREE